MGLIGSSAVVLFDSNGCPSGCDGAGEGCRVPKLSTTIIVDQRQRRMFPCPPKVCDRSKNPLMSIFGELWSKDFLMQRWLAVVPPTCALQLVKM